ncbi:MAG: AzlC family ABC transporter permease [Burkholderiales bacterium]|jgi:4-azaleucine resistance transporter AzlC|nr:AzlC family ABC transporter permease [Burkholderiales bacterium]
MTPKTDPSLSPDATRRAEFWGGVFTELPLLLGVVPFGLVFGVLGLQSGLPAWATIAMSVIVFGGASQMIFVQLWGLATPVTVIAATVSVTNLRHVLYSAAVAPYLLHLPRHWKIILSYLLTDEAFAASLPRFREGAATPFRHWFLLGAGVTLWTGWWVSTVLGVVLGRAIPERWGLDFSVTLTFITLTVMSIQRRSEAVAAIAAMATALLTRQLPFKLWILAAAVVGILCGVVARRFDKR